MTVQQESFMFRDLGDFQLERHVIQAIGIAKALSGEQGVSAANLLSAVLIVVREGGGSDAFTQLARLLPLKMKNLPQISVTDSSLEMRLSPGLAETYPVALEFFSKKTIVWGRDFVTFAILASSDPSLREIASEAGTTVEQLQADWFHWRPDCGRKDQVIFLPAVI